MANENPALIGAANATGDDRALFYKIFTGEVLTAYSEKNVMESRHRIRNISGQKSASFANTGRAFGGVHAPGEEIFGQDMRHNETVITVDDLIVAPVFVADIYEAMNHYEVRGEYAKQMGNALARTFDKQCLRVAATAATEANKITGQGLPGGTTVRLPADHSTASDADKAVALADSLFAAHQQLVENEVETDEAFAFVTPADYFRLVRNKDLLNTDWGGLGSYARAEIPMVGGLPLVVTKHIPQAVDAQDGNGDYRDQQDFISSKYAGDYSSLQSIVMTPDAMGTVKLLDINLQSEWDIRRQGTLMVSRMAVGHGTLRPECAVRIDLDATNP
jgi:hypothetical protein